MSRRPCCGNTTAINLPTVPLLPTPSLSWAHLPSAWETYLSPETTDLGKRQRGVLSLLDIRYGTDLLPTSQRFLYYEAEHEGWLFKKRTCSHCGAAVKKTDDQYLSEAVESLRPDIALYDWFVDETRTWTTYDRHATVEDALRERLRSRWLDPWVWVPRPLLLFESRSLEGVMRPTLAARGVAHTAFNGQSGKAHLANNVAPWLDAHPESDVLYAGDLDDPGKTIEREAERFIRARAPLWRGSWTRVTLTEDQVAVLVARGMSPIRKLDSRYSPKRWVTAWETEALGQEEVRDIITAAVDVLLPRPLADIFANEEVEDRLMREYLDGFAAWRAAR